MAKGAVVARILSQYSDKGTKAAAKDLASMQKKFGDFANKAMKAFGVAAIAAGAFAAKVGVDAVKAAAQDQQSQALLANALRGTTGATDDAIAATEAWISKTQLALGVADDELRPAFGRLAAVTGDVTKAQGLMGAALDIAAAKNISVDAAAAAVSKAYGGQLTGLKKLFPQISAATVKSKDFAGALGEIQGEIGGAAKAKANTFAGQMDRIKVAMGEASESLGYKLLPMVQHFADLLITKVIPAIQKWVDENGQKIANVFAVAISYGIAFGKLMFKVFKFVAENTRVFIVLGATIVAMFAGAKVAAAVTALIGAFTTIIKLVKLLRTEGLKAAFVTSLATGGVSAAAGAAAFALALTGMAVATRKFNSDAKKAGDGIGEFNFQTQKFTANAGTYVDGLEDLFGATDKLTEAQKNQIKVMLLLERLRKKFGIKPNSSDPITLEAIRRNLVKQRGLGNLSSPTISLAAAAGANGTIGSNTSVNGGNVTVNVAGSVVSDQDLVIAVQNGLETLARRNGTTASGLRVSQQVA